MKTKMMHPNSPKAIDAAIERIHNMTPEEAIAFFKYRPPGVEETDMTGMLSRESSNEKPKRSKRSEKAA